MNIFVVLLTWFGVVVARSNPIGDFLSQDFIDQINHAQQLWKAGRNFAANTTTGELLDLLGVEMTLSTLLFMRKVKDPLWPADKDIPEFFDARKKWSNCTVIAEVLDQSRCGSCWAMSPAQVATDRYCIASNGQHDIRLSGQEILGCAVKRFRRGCKGGVPAEAYQFIRKNGLVSGGSHLSNEGCQPYFMPKCAHHGAGSLTPCDQLERLTPECNLTCSNKEYLPKFHEDVRRFSSVYKMANNERSIQKDIMTYGPLSTQFQVHEDFFVYKSGVYEPVWRNILNGRPLQGPRGHTLKILGWGTENGVPYWLGMNTWNDHWGDRGTIKMRRRSWMLLEQTMYGVIPQIDSRFSQGPYKSRRDSSTNRLKSGTQSKLIS